MMLILPVCLIYFIKQNRFISFSLPFMIFIEDKLATEKLPTQCDQTPLPFIFDSTINIILSSDYIIYDMLHSH